MTQDTPEVSIAPVVPAPERSTDVASSPHPRKERRFASLSDFQIRGAKATGKGYKLYDGSGHYLFVTAKGAKSWRLKYYVKGQEQSPLTLGLYPHVGAKLARARRDKALTLLAEGRDPRDWDNEESLKKVRLFEPVAREWWAARKASERWDEGYAVHGLDARENPDPMSVNFGRQSVKHSIFGGGIHTCAGAHLARTEIKILLEEWLTPIPEFTVDPSSEIGYMGGIVASVKPFTLVWDTESTKGESEIRH